MCVWYPWYVYLLIETCKFIAISNTNSDRKRTRGEVKGKDVPEPDIVLSDGKMGLEWTGSGQGNSKLCGQDTLVWDVPEPVTVLSDGKMGLEWTG